MHYDVGVLSLWFGLGAAMIVGAVQAAGWRHRVLIWGLIGAGSLCIAAALLWPLVVDLWPWLSRMMAKGADDPSSWIALFLFGAALIVFSRPKATGQNVPVSDGADPIALNDLRVKTNDTFATMDEYFEGRLKGVGQSLTAIWTVLNASKETVEAVDKRTAVPQNLGDTVIEAFESVQGALQSQLARMRDEIKGFGDKIQTSNRLIANNCADTMLLLDFTTMHATNVLIGNILKFLPTLPMPDSMTQDESLSISEFIAAVRSTLANTAYAPSVTHVLHNAETETDDLLQRTPVESYPSSITPAVMRKRMIAIRQVELLCVWLADLRKGLDGQMATQRANLANSLQQRSSTTQV